MVLEIAENSYSKKYGGSKVYRFEILHAKPDNPKATFVGDLTDSSTLPENKIDCFICTQTLNFIFNVQDEDGSPIEGVSVYMQYNMFGNIEESLFRPTTLIDFSVADASTIRFVIELLDGTIIQEWTDSYTAGSGYFRFIPPENEITGGLQMYKYSMEILEQNEGDGRSEDFLSPSSPTSNSLSYNYPNPFN